MKNMLLIIIFIVTFIPTGDAKGIKLLVMDSQSGEPYKTIRKHLYMSLAEAGYVKGVNLEVFEFSIGNREGLVKRLKEQYIEKKKIKYVYVSGTLATMGAKKYLMNTSAKVIFAAPTDPVGIGVIKNFSTPPAFNFTGICYPVAVDKRIDFLRKVIPNLKTIGYVYTKMPQSLSYLAWLKEVMGRRELAGIKLELRSVPFIKSNGGQKRMTQLAVKHIKELDSKVDVFLSPNDQMGTQPEFAKMVSKYATKPLVGVGRKDVVERWGATVSIYPDLKNISEVAASMLVRLFQGEAISNIMPQWPMSGVALNQSLVKKHKLKISADLLKQSRSTASLISQ
jgi:putative ABC transport system substrate-binding protein